jgi:hypothetical protein
MVVPVDADINEAEDVAQKDRNCRAKRFERRAGRRPGLRSRTMIVMTIAKTPSLKTSRRPLFIAEVSRAPGGA